ncbi:MAG: PRD domain-containing protein [Clostridium celatum]|uniref:BglG family transcription antiterminator LicT n=1 Tax=uncultured Clostridium sp. TaxID=59620 RepID=UPI0025E53DFD|nr:PRD domain-containing protein [uncultured Clostridium sp.]MDU2123568.1 PRD domain-containing protein [Clostridium celatum]MDU4885034.1 PRD domain-containing protein [Clostridium celatum]MDU4978276.1 PRD domain-containing protein [Clostridium celatum]MDU7078294.1 PRD domain-containing protein [Clostridium celatum]
MEIVKVMNNSLVFVKNDDNNEIIVMGKGIGFMKKAGEFIDSSKIEKIFTLKDDEAKKNYFRAMEDVSSEYVDVTNDIVKYASDILNCKLNDNVFISLIDHISFAIERFNKNISLQNRLLWEVKKFYPNEFKVGIYAVNKINDVLGVKLPEEEAGNIAFHIVNAQTENSEMENTILMIKMMKDILNIIKYHLDVKLDKESLNYSRFITHLQFFLQRVIEGKVADSKNSFILAQVESQYPEKVNCARSIKSYVEKLLNIEVGDDEILYLAMHIIRVS